MSLTRNPAHADAIARGNVNELVGLIQQAEEEAVRQAQLATGAMLVLTEVRLYGEKMLRDFNGDVRSCGADLLGILGDS